MSISLQLSRAGWGGWGEGGGGGGGRGPLLAIGNQQRERESDATFPEASI